LLVLLSSSLPLWLPIVSSRCGAGYIPPFRHHSGRGDVKTFTPAAMDAWSTFLLASDTDRVDLEGGRGGVAADCVS
jgi:hypothetical protein